MLRDLRGVLLTCTASDRQIDQYELWNQQSSPLAPNPSCWGKRPESQRGPITTDKKEIPAFLKGDFSTPLVWMCAHTHYKFRCKRGDTQNFTRATPYPNHLQRQYYIILKCQVVAGGKGEQE